MVSISSPPFSNPSTSNLCSACPAPTTTPTAPATRKRSSVKRTQVDTGDSSGCDAMSPIARGRSADLSWPPPPPTAPPKGQLWVLVPAPPAPRTRTPKSEARVTCCERQRARVARPRPRRCRSPPAAAARCWRYPARSGSSCGCTANHLRCREGRPPALEDKRQGAPAGH